ncbi:MAG: methylthioribulose 1-phosphate dehydratase [Gemmatimonadetes bacterium]|nr:MAG: methylthioribulose 1-phosphate dehydratase [Gemmatimonadota bacterium]
MPSEESFASLAQQLVEIGRQSYARGWTFGTSGNFSAVVSREPLRLAITTSGVDKGLLNASQIVQIDETGRVLGGGAGKPSAEARLHVAVARARGVGAGAVLHTHSIWSTVLSDAAADGGVVIEGYEMLKGLDGVSTHQHREWLPIIENTQDWAIAAAEVEQLLRANPKAHGFLIRRHGLYTWGRDLAAAKRQMEILEFLFEAMGRKRGMTWQP